LVRHTEDEGLRGAREQTLSAVRRRRATARSPGVARAGPNSRSVWAAPRRRQGRAGLRAAMRWGSSIAGRARRGWALSETCVRELDGPSHYDLSRSSDGLGRIPRCLDPSEALGTGARGRWRPDRLRASAQDRSAIFFYFFILLSDRINPAAIGSGQRWVLGQTDLDPANRS
jgi:hypothetical protein